MSIAKSLGTAAIVVLAMLAGSGGAAIAGSYPTRTIHITVPWKAGGGTDSIARGFAAAVRKVVDVPVVVTDVSGASGAVGTLDFLKKRADGYTWYFNGDSDLAAMLYFNKNLPVSLDKFAYIGGVYRTPVWVISNSERGYKNLDDLIAQGKSHQIKIGTAGLKGMHAVVADDIRGEKNLNAKIIPYAGGGTLKVALLGNKVDAGVIWSPVLLSAVKAGRVNALAAGDSLSKLHYADAGQIKTLEQYDIPISSSITRGIYVKAGTSAEVKADISSIVKSAVEDKGFQEFGASFGFDPVWVPGNAFKESNYKSYSDIKSILEKYPMH